MAKEIVINAEQEQTRIAILEDGDLVELFIENTEHARTLGDIYLGRIRKIMPSIQAAFVDIGQKQDAFLHFSDLADNLPDLLTFLEAEQPEVGAITPSSDSHKHKGKRRRPSGRRKDDKQDASEQKEDGDAQDEKDDAQRRSSSDAKRRGQRRSTQRRSRRRQGSSGSRGRDDGPRPDTYLKRDQRILVKIVKEPISNKGSRVSTDISLAGRFLVLVPLANYVAVSKKIYSYKERRRLRALARSLVPEGFGVIVRTVAEGKNAKALDTDLRLLLEKWRKIEKKLAGHPTPPLGVHEDVNMVSSVIRDLFSDDYERIQVDEPRLYRNIKNYIQAVAPQMVPAVQLHKSKQPIFEATKIHKAVAEAFESRVDLPTGGYLFIERTEAMHVIDVNSGRSGRGMTQEENSLRVNLEAARVVGKQVRLRDLGGIIVVDFIDLRSENNKRKVYDELRKEFKRDRAVSKILPMSDFGLIQITRQRLRPSITTTFSGPNGDGEKSSDAGKSNEAGRSFDASRSLDAGRPGGRTSDANRGRRDDRGRKKEENDQDARPEAPEPEAAPQQQRRNDRGSGGGRSRSGRRRGGRSQPSEPQQAEMSPQDLLKEMEEWIAAYKSAGHRRSVTLRVHPFTAAYLNRKVPNHPTRWFMKHLVRIRLEADEALSPTSYRFLDARTGEDVTENLDALPGPDERPETAESSS